MNCKRCGFPLYAGPESFGDSHHPDECFEFVKDEVTRLLAQARPRLFSETIPNVGEWFLEWSQFSESWSLHAWTNHDSSLLQHMRGRKFWLPMPPAPEE